MKTPLISVIIPAYNAAKTLERALKSLVPSKDASDLEVLLVENGSSDNSLELLEGLKASLPYDLVPLTSEKGVSIARNKGIALARGTWLMFLDADDYLVPGAIDALLQDARASQADLIAYGHQKTGEVRRVCERDLDLTQEDSQAQALVMVGQPTVYLQAWAKLIRRDLIGESRFDSHLTCAEDSDFILSLLTKGPRLSLREAAPYFYSTDNLSTMRQFSVKMLDAYHKAMTVTAGRIPDDPLWQKAFARYVAIHINIAMVRGLYYQGNPMTAGQKRAVLKDYVHQAVYKDALKQLKMSDLKSVNLLPAVLLKLGGYRLAGKMFDLRAKQNAKNEKVGD